MRKLREGMQTDLEFKNVYWSSNGSQIIEVTHESSKEPDDRVHPVSYMAFINLPSNAKVHVNFPINLGRLWRGEQQLYVEPEVYEPLPGFYHDTYWSAKAAIEMDEDPAATIDVYMKVARNERSSKGQANLQKIGARHFDDLAASIEDAREAGELPANIRTTVDELGGGLQGLGIYYAKDRSNPEWSGNTENTYWWVTDWEEPPLMGLYITDDEGNYLLGEDGADNLFEFPYNAGRFTKPTNPRHWVNPDSGAYFDIEDWNLENPKCIEQIVQTLVLIHKFASSHLEMVPNL